ncbi:MAG TPA: hypothetical protein VMK12_16355, partial [Anaeromyxobacteraceae bacterium]|nr:hypothetical protein [Anaeromyxobacteraceae bacterium]
GAGTEDISNPTTVVGTGTPESCTPQVLEKAVQGAGVITFNCGADPVIITLDRELQIFNDSGPNHNGDTVIDGGGKVTLSGGGATRILYQNACDQNLHWTSARCDLQDHPRLVVQNLVLADGNSQDPENGGGAIYVRSGTLKVVNSVFVRNQCTKLGPDVGGGAIYALAPQGQVFIVGSTFGGGPGEGNVGANGGALGSIGASFTVVNSVMSYNQALGHGQNSGNGGNGGAIYNDGDTYTLTICGSNISNKSANELGGAVFYVSDDASGTLQATASAFSSNACTDPQHPPGFYVMAAHTMIKDSTVDGQPVSISQ